MAVRPGHVLDGGWEVLDKLGHGTYADVFEGIHLETGVLAALKVAKPGPPLQWEATVLEKLQKYSFVPRFYALT